MKKSSQMIEWLKESKFAIKTPVNHMFWVHPADVCNRSSGVQTIGDLCLEIKQQLHDERIRNDTDDIQDWYFWDYYSSQGDRYCVFTQMPPLDNDIFYKQSCSVERLAKIKKLLGQYKSVIKHHHFRKILATDGVLSWLHYGTGLQWTTFSYLQSTRNDYAEVLNDLCYAGYTDWRIPTIHEIRAMLSSDKEILKVGEHPLADSLPFAMPLPVEQTPGIYPSSDSINGYYIFNKESTVRTGTRYNRNDERIDYGGHYVGKFIAVRGERKLNRSFQTGWAGTLLQWTEKNMTLVEQGQLPGSSKGWKNLKRLMLRGEHFKSDDYMAAGAAMEFLENLEEVWLTVDKYFHEIPYSIYNLSQIKKLRVQSENSSLDENEKWSISHISSEIKNMKNIEDIQFDWQGDLTKIPDEIFNLPNLTSLSIAGCWGLILSEKQVIKICDLVQAGVSIYIPPLKIHTKSSRENFIKAVKDNGGEIDWNTIKRVFGNDVE